MTSVERHMKKAQALWDEMIENEKKARLAEREKVMNDLESMTGLKKIVASELFVEWLIGDGGMGGLTKPEYDKLAEPIYARGYTEEEVFDMVKLLASEYFGKS